VTRGLKRLGSGIRFGAETLFLRKTLEFIVSRRHLFSSATFFRHPSPPPMKFLSGESEKGSLLG